VYVRPIGCKVGKVTIGGKEWDCTITNSQPGVGFRAGDVVTLSHGTTQRTLNIGEGYIDGDTILVLTVDPWGTHVQVVPPLEFVDATYDGDGLTVVGEVFGEHWAVLGEDGRIRLPRGFSRWIANFTLKGSDGGLWSAEFSQGPTKFPIAAKLTSGPLDCALTAAKDGDSVTLRVSFASPSGLALRSVKRVGQGPETVAVEFLDAAGSVVGSADLRPEKPSAWSARVAAPTGAVKVRLKVDFGPFAIKPSDVVAID
jgi:hypothetical protein